MHTVDGLAVLNSIVLNRLFVSGDQYSCQKEAMGHRLEDTSRVDKLLPLLRNVQFTGLDCFLYKV